VVVKDAEFLRKSIAETLDTEPEVSCPTNSNINSNNLMASRHSHTHTKLMTCGTRLSLMAGAGFVLSFRLTWFFVEFCVVSVIKGFLRVSYVERYG
jgi:hypothetical protein